MVSDWDGWCHGDYVPSRFQMSHWKRPSGDYVPLLPWNMKVGNDSLHIDSSHFPFKFSRRWQCRIHAQIHPDHCMVQINFSGLHRGNFFPVKKKNLFHLVINMACLLLGSKLVAIFFAFATLIIYRMVNVCHDHKWWPTFTSLFKGQNMSNLFMVIWTGLWRKPFLAKRAENRFRLGLIYVTEQGSKLRKISAYP